jgi:glycerol-3-phosphate acyltransferase PlsY
MATLPLPHAPGDLAALAVSYLLGAVPVGLVLIRLVKGVDIRSVGSGNIGATNAMRAGGRPLGLTVFALDCLKGLAAAVWVAPGLGEAAGAGLDALQVACGAAAVGGHCFPIYLRFRGGKGVATACGALVGLDWRVFLWGGAAWLVTLALTRYVGLASMVMGATFVAAAWGLDGGERPALVVGAALLFVLILARHRSNISRMLAGTEPKLSSTRRGDAGGRP